MHWLSSWYGGNRRVKHRKPCPLKIMGQYDNIAEEFDTVNRLYITNSYEIKSSPLAISSFSSFKLKTTQPWKTADVTACILVVLSSSLEAAGNSVQQLFKLQKQKQQIPVIMHYPQSCNHICLCQDGGNIIFLHSAATLATPSLQFPLVYKQPYMVLKLDLGSVTFSTTESNWSWPLAKC